MAHLSRRTLAIPATPMNACRTLKTLMTSTETRTFFIYKIYQLASHRLIQWATTPPTHTQPLPPVPHHSTPEHRHSGKTRKRRRATKVRCEFSSLPPAQRNMCRAHTPFVTSLSFPAPRPRLHKVGARPRLHCRVVRLGDLTENAKLPLQLLVEDKNRRHVPAAVAIIGRGPHGD